MNFLHILSKNLRINSKSLCKCFTTRNIVNDFNINNEKQLTFDDFKCLSTNKLMETKIKLILSEYLNYRNREEDMDCVPSTLTVHQMRQLLDCNEFKKRGRKWINLSSTQRKHLLLLMKRSQVADGLNRLTAPLLPYEVKMLPIISFTNVLIFNICLFASLKNSIQIVCEIRLFLVKMSSSTYHSTIICQLWSARN